MFTSASRWACTLVLLGVAVLSSTPEDPRGDGASQFAAESSQVYAGASTGSRVPAGPRTCVCSSERERANDRISQGHKTNAPINQGLSSAGESIARLADVGVAEAPTGAHVTEVPLRILAASWAESDAPRGEYGAHTGVETYHVPLDGEIKTRRVIALSELELTYETRSVQRARVSSNCLASTSEDLRPTRQVNPDSSGTGGNLIDAESRDLDALEHLGALEEPGVPRGPEMITSNENENGPGSDLGSLGDLHDKHALAETRAFFKSMRELDLVKDASFQATLTLAPESQESRQMSKDSQSGPGTGTESASRPDGLTVPSSGSVEVKLARVWADRGPLYAHDALCLRALLRGASTFTRGRLGTSPSAIRLSVELQVERHQERHGSLSLVSSSVSRLVHLGTLLISVGFRGDKHIESTPSPGNARASSDPQHKNTHMGELIVATLKTKKSSARFLILQVRYADLVDWCTVLDTSIRSGVESGVGGQSSQESPQSRTATDETLVDSHLWQELMNAPRFFRAWIVKARVTLGAVPPVVTPRPIAKKQLNRQKSGRSTLSEQTDGHPARPSNLGMGSNSGTEFNPNVASTQGSTQGGFVAYTNQLMAFGSVRANHGWTLRSSIVAPDSSLLHLPQEVIRDALAIRLSDMAAMQPGTASIRRRSYGHSRFITWAEYIAAQGTLVSRVDVSLLMEGSLVVLIAPSGSVALCLSPPVEGRAFVGCLRGTSRGAALAQMDDSLDHATVSIALRLDHGAGKSVSGSVGNSVSRSVEVYRLVTEIGEIVGIALVMVDSVDQRSSEAAMSGSFGWVVMI